MVHNGSSLKKIDIHDGVLVMSSKTIKGKKKWIGWLVEERRVGGPFWNFKNIIIEVHIY